jgi:hypothetical protein
MDIKFLVRLDPEPTFLTSMRGDPQKPYGSSFPTQALQMTFDAATETCRRLQRMGYEGAIVVDRFGQPPSVADLAAVKQAVEYQVVFHSRYFAGQNAQNLDLGSSDRNDAINMSQAAAIVVVKRLKKMGFSDAVAVESSSKVVNPDVQDELKRIWPAEFAGK